MYSEGCTSIEIEDFKKDTNIEKVSDKRYKIQDTRYKDTKSGMRQNYSEETIKYLE
jgi:hypothetical protein